MFLIDKYKVDKLLKLYNNNLQLYIIELIVELNE